MPNEIALMLLKITPHLLGQLLLWYLLLVPVQARCGFPTEDEWEVICKNLIYCDEKVLPFLEEPPEAIYEWLTTPIDPDDPDGILDTPLNTCVRYGHLALLQVLFLRIKGRDLNQVFDCGGKNRLMRDACESGKPEVVQYLLDNGMSATANTAGDTPMLYAAAWGHLPIMQCLLAHGASPTVTINTDDYTPLHAASFSGYLREVKWLLAQGASPMAVTDKGETPLYEAAATGQLSVMQLLLMHGVSPTALTDKGSTALHPAACHKDPRFVQCLLSSVPFTTAIQLIDHKNSHGQTAAEGAKEIGYSSVAQYLLDYRINPPLQELSPPSLQNLASFKIWRATGHIDRMKALVDGTRQPALFPVILGEIGLK